MRVPHSDEYVARPDIDRFGRKVLCRIETKLLQFPAVKMNFCALNSMAVPVANVQSRCSGLRLVNNPATNGATASMTISPARISSAFTWRFYQAAVSGCYEVVSRYFNASLISISRFSTSVTSSDRSTPRCSAFPEKYSHTPLSMETALAPWRLVECGEAPEFLC